MKRCDYLQAPVTWEYGRPINPVPLTWRRGREMRNGSPALQPLGLLEGVCDAFEREVWDTMRSKETLDIPADERQRLGMAHGEYWTWPPAGYLVPVPSHQRNMLPGAMLPISSNSRASSIRNPSGITWGYPTTSATTSAPKPWVKSITA
jgi:hypothetical protein